MQPLNGLLHDGLDALNRRGEDFFRRGCRNANDRADACPRERAARDLDEERDDVRHVKRDENREDRRHHDVEHDDRVHAACMVHGRRKRRGVRAVLEELAVHERVADPDEVPNGPDENRRHEDANHEHGTALVAGHGRGLTRSHNSPPDLASSPRLAGA